MNIVNCDKCKNDFEIKTETEQLEGAERVYFTCPHCGAQYTAYYLNDDIKDKQDEMRKLQETYNAAYKKRDRIQAEKLFKQMQKLQKEIKADMIKLKNLHGGE